jgi:hypothetical protein
MGKRTWEKINWIESLIFTLSKAQAFSHYVWLKPTISSFTMYKNPIHITIGRAIAKV